MNFDFFQLSPIPDNAMSGYYNEKLVILSYIVAVLASLVTLEIAQEIRRTKRSIFWLLIGGACTMGAGIFSMHFVGMLAFIMPMPARYDIFWTLISLAIAIIISGFAFYVVRHPAERIKYSQLIGGGCILGIGIASMHFTGMEGMLGMKNRYLPGLFTLSIAVAIAASIAALYLMVECNKGSPRRKIALKAGSALVMGAAIAGMHYIGMAAAVMTPAPVLSTETTLNIISPEKLSFLVAFTASSIMIIALLLIGFKHVILVKILIGFMITPVFLTPFAVVLLQNVEEVERWENTLSKEMMLPMQSLLELENAFQRTYEYVPYFSSKYSEKEWALNKGKVLGAFAKMDELEKEYAAEKSAYNKPVSLDQKNINILKDKMTRSISTLIALLEENASPEAIEAERHELDHVQNAIEGLIQDASTADFLLFNAWAKENKPLQMATGYTYLLITAVMVILSIIACVVIALDISNPLKEAVTVINKLTLGDVDFNIESYSRNETGQLLVAMNALASSNRQMSDALTAVSKGDLSITVVPRSEKDNLGLALSSMIKNLRNINGKIQGEVINLTVSSEEIVDSVMQVAQSSSEAASAVVQTQVSVEELKQIAHVTDEKSKYVLNNSQETIEIVNKSENLLQSTISDMQKINEKMQIISESIVKLSEHNQTIGEIIDSVNDLAEQSNLLAVNAAIEAAIAGEHGKSFAVVAKEIRVLAEQSKVATQQVRSILNEIQNSTAAVILAAEQGAKAVENGVKQSIETNQSMQMLAKSVKHVTKAANQIAISSQQQFIGVEQVTVAMHNISNSTTHLVDHMKSIESAVVSLNSIGSSLKEMTDQYIMNKRD